MKIRRMVFLIMIAVVATAVPALANNQKRPLHLHALTNYETHDQQGNDYDYLYTGMVVTKVLRQDYTGIVSYLNKYNLDLDDTQSHIYSASLNNIRNNRFSLLYSLTHYSNPTSATLRHTNRWLFMGQYKLRESKKRALTSYTSYSTASDFSDSRTVNQKFKYRVQFTKKFKAAVHAQYSYNFNYSDNVFNIYGVDTSYAITDNLKFNINYMLVDMQTQGIEDDNIFKAGLFWSIF